MDSNINANLLKPEVIQNLDTIEWRIWPSPIFTDLRLKKQNGTGFEMKGTETTTTTSERIKVETPRLLSSKSLVVITIQFCIILLWK